jgi:hypothetical protein
VTLTEFLTARMDEDEALGRGWTEHGIGSFGPRVLREVEAKRAIVAAYVDSETCLNRGYTELTRGSQLARLSVCRHLAAVYSDHPDYRDEWRP